MNVDVKHPVMRVFMLGFGVVFSGVGLLGLVTNPDILGLVVGPMMIATGLWLAGMGVVNVQVRDGERVGGGPLLPAVKLERDEPVLADCAATYHRASGKPSGPENYRYLPGQVFLTDRRLIFSPFRFRYLARPAALALKDVVNMTAGRRSMWVSGTMEVLDIQMNDGSAHTVGFANAEVRNQVTVALSRPCPTASTTLPPLDIRLWHVLAATACSAGVLIALVGSRTPPYVRGPDGPLIWILIVCVMAWPLVEMYRWARSRLGQ